MCNARGRRRRDRFGSGIPTYLLINRVGRLGFIISNGILEVLFEVLFGGKDG